MVVRENEKMTAESRIKKEQRKILFIKNHLMKDLVQIIRDGFH